MVKLSRDFPAIVRTLDYLEICRIVIYPDGKIGIPAEKEGRIAQAPPRTRKSVAREMRAFADRLECPDPKHVRGAKKT